MGRPRLPRDAGPAHDLRRRRGRVAPAVAARMLAAGMGKGTRVGLFFTYGHEWVVAWLAASRIGALVMPLATTYRPAEIRKVLRIGDIDTLITAPSVLGRDMLEMLEASVPGLADARRRAAVPPRRAVPAADLGRRARRDRRWATTVDLDAPAGARRRHRRPACVRSRPRWCRATSRRSRTRRVPAPTPRASCTPTARSCAPRARSPRCRPRAASRAAASARSPSSGSAARSFSAPRCQSGATVLCIERFEPGAALDLVEAERATARARLADSAAVDARPPVVPRTATCPRSAGSPSAPPTSRWSRARCRGSPRTAA